MRLLLLPIPRCAAALAVLLTLLSARPLVARDDDRPARPNVILIMTDDQGYGDLACHGNPHVKTSALDRLHDESLRLTQFHVDPTCSPTRSALMTGRYSCRTGVWHTIMGRSILRRDEVTMGDVFAANGYRTGIFGKWHLGDNYPSRPQDRGFDESLVNGGGGVTQTPDFWGNDYFDDTYYHNGRPEPQQGYCTNVFFDAALEFIRRNREQTPDRPFFAYLPTNVAHGPYNVAEEYSQPYRELGLPQQVANFYGMLTNFDENLDRLQRQLKEWDLEDDTLLIYLTDNGSSVGHFGGGMRGRKGSEYDGGHRVPCFFHWPGKIKPGELGRLTAHIDLLPTLIDLCGLEPPQGVKFDGTSLVPAILDRKALPERTLFVQSHRIEHPQPWRKSAVMTDRWRLVDGEELYDIVADPEQKKDLASAEPQVVARLRKQYEAWYADVSERFDEYCEIVVGADEENPARITCHDWHGQVVPWNQGMVRRAPLANGFWAVEVARAGNYEFELRQQPRSAKFPLQAATARIKLGSVEQSSPVEKGADHVRFELKLPAGKARLQTWLTQADGKSRGAYFVYVRRLE